MKKILCAGLSIFLYAQSAQAITIDSQLDKELEAVALSHFLQDSLARQELNDQRGLFDILEQLKDMIEGYKDAFLTTFDANGNGIIDLGPELDFFKKTLHDLALIVADSNNDGEVAQQEVAMLVQQLLKSLHEQTKDQVCTQIIVQAQDLGAWLNFRPLLKHLYQRCITVE